MYIEGFNITLDSITMKISSVVGTIQTNMIYYGLTVAAPHVVVHNDIHLRCPVFFRVEVNSAHTPTYSMLSLQCHSCESDKYTIVEPVLKISDISPNQSIPQVGFCIAYTRLNEHHLWTPSRNSDSPIIRYPYLSPIDQ